MINHQEPSIPSTKPCHWIGIDGCKGGWIIAWIQADQSAELHYAESLRPFLQKVPDSAVILIDMILYKSCASGPRQFDRFAKSQLGKWHSRVFPAPPQDALTAQDYPEACQRSHAISGKKISKQCYNLFPKIREANDPAIPSAQMLEYHPEIAFKQLNEGVTVEASKKTELGRSIRQQLIASHLPNVPTSPIHAQRKTWQADDILDALALALVAQKGSYKDFYQSLALSKALKHVQINENFSWT